MWTRRNWSWTRRNWCWAWWRWCATFMLIYATPLLLRIRPTCLPIVVSCKAIELRWPRWWCGAPFPGFLTAKLLLRNGPSCSPITVARIAIKDSGISTATIMARSAILFVARGRIRQCPSTITLEGWHARNLGCTMRQCDLGDYVGGVPHAAPTARAAAALRQSNSNRASKCTCNGHNQCCHTNTCSADTQETRTKRVSLALKLREELLLIGLEGVHVLHAEEADLNRSCQDLDRKSVV